MIEIKISDSAAQMLLNERMAYELSLRKKASILPEQIHLSELGYENLLEIAEVAIADLVMTIPPEILTSKNNLNVIVTNTMNGLHRIYNFEEFKEYSLKRANRLLNRLNKYFEISKEAKYFKYN